MELEDIKPPIGQFIIDSGVKALETQNGHYYHYSDVCILLKKFANQKLDEYSEKLCNQLNDAGLHQAESIVIDMPYPL